MNIENTIVPKSDQLNADDLISGPRTITITGVKAGSAEQPVTINYQGDDGHPYKPGKSMRRVLVAMWGPEASAYVGRSLTLFRDPDVKFGGMDTGGIRISHATHIDAPFRIALTVTRGKRAPFTVQPLKIAAKATITPAEELPDVDLARDIGATKAGQGEAALKEWWTGLTPALRRALADELPKWKETAAAL
jgi:hypothetical protein